jgi:tetratricopeptide (TPR) repeat protein
MTATATATRGLSARLGLAPGHLEPAAAWLLGFAPVTYLALSGGGYDIVARSEIAIVLWWIVLLGAIVGVFPNRRFGAVAWAGLALFGAFVAWTWLAVGWTESKEQTLAEVGRVAGYLGILALGLALVSRRNVSALLCGLASAVAIVTTLSVLSRLVPAWFPGNSAAQFYATARLGYPFDYSDGVGEFAAFGFPLLLFVATGARSLVARVLGAAALPVVVLCLALTVSRGGILATVVGLVVFFALVPDRLPRLATLLAVAVASAGLMLELLHLPGVRNALNHPSPPGQRHSMLLVLVLACVFAGLVQAGLRLLATKRTRPGWLKVSRRGSIAIAAGMLAVVLIALIVVIASGADNRLWQQFKQPNPPAAGNSYFRLLSVAGSHRYQYWQAAFHAFEAHPWDGIGPGTFQFYWLAHNSLAEFVRNAHSLWIETLAELGIIGAALIGGFFVFAMIAGTVRAFRAPPATRLAIATAVAGTAAFCAAAAFDWVWQIGVIPMIAMLLVAVALGGDDDRGSRYTRLATRIVLAVGAIVASWAILVPLAETIEVRSSQSAVLRGDFKTALADAQTAQNIEPSAASPRLQRALVLEQLGDISGARQAIAEAAAREAVNAQIWLVASRLATEANQPRQALADYERARSLDPTSPIFRGP